MRFHTVADLGPKRSLTPEGFLVVKDAALARTGVQDYGPGECPLDPGPDGIVRVARTAAEVFRKETIDSFAGKPVCNDHPENEGERIDVLPLNWKLHGVGVILDPRRGEGIHDDLLIGDLLIFDHDAIEAILAGKRELSCGYNADWFSTGDGEGEQHNIMGNHVALVDAGRCGPRCAIGDHESEGECSVEKKPLFDRIRDAFKKRDEKALDAAIGELSGQPTGGEGGGHHVHVHLAPPPESTSDKKGADEMAEEKKDEEKKAEDRRFTDAEIGSRFETTDKRIGDLEKKIDDGFKKIADKLGARDEEEEKKEEKEEKAEDESILNNLEMEAPPGTNDAARKARDSRYLEDSFQETIAIAEVLAPGIRLPTFDKAAKPGVTFDAMCRFRRSALDVAYAGGEGKAIIDELLGGRAYDSGRMGCSDVRMLFRSAGTMQRAHNNRGLTTGVGIGPGHPTLGGGKTLADINKRNREYYGQKK